MAYVQHVTMLLQKQIKELKMLSPRLTDCIECASIPALLEDIDLKLTALAVSQYNNIIFSLNNYIPGEVIGDLLNYKQILTYKQCNPSYCQPFTVQMIASRVILLINK
jgi:hypothetical protein